PPPATSGKKASYAFVTNGVAGFWTIAKAGADKAGADLGVDVITIMPSGITDQTRRMEDLLTRGTNGIAISPIKPEAQGEIIDDAAGKTNLITHDSDAPDSKRLLYIGMDNYAAGLICGKLTRDAIPDGGKVMIFIGRLDQDNAKRRRQGCIDGILGRKADPSRRDPVGEVIKSDDGKYVILGTMTDNFDRAKAKANAEDALTRDPEIAAMVGLFEYNPPLIMEALERAGRLDK
ncbi:MAG: substrate-binding domain-containing protein, partial [Phycisphaerae bacterium]|nr:substrate-binding domain-containing protein [Phycisphaerae bacterium]